MLLKQAQAGIFRHRAAGPLAATTAPSRNVRQLASMTHTRGLHSDRRYANMKMLGQIREYFT